MKVNHFSLILLYCFTSSECKIAKEEYHEEMLLKPLDGYVYSYFQFTTIWETAFKNDLFDHCTLFPRPVGEIIQRHNVQELHITLTKGLWRHDVWGYPIRPGPPGAELWVWFKPNTTDIDTKWKELTGALSGLLCASLNFIDSQNTISPRFSLRPEGIEPLHMKDDPNNNERLRYASLPREIVCTENLTPWKKLLPCGNKRGLSTLLNSDHIYNTVYHSLGLHFRPVCMEERCGRRGVELTQTVSLMYDLAIINPDEPLWSLVRLFGVGMTRACPLANTSKIYVDTSPSQTGLQFTLRPGSYQLLSKVVGGDRDVQIASYDLTERGKEGPYNLEGRYPRTPLGALNPNKAKPLISVNRYLTGYGQEFGGIQTRIVNRGSAPVRAIFLENLPWYVQVYMHTLRIHADGNLIQPLAKTFRPGKERQRPYHLELVLQLPPHSTVLLTLHLDYTFLRWQEYPPDAHHGFYAGAASLTAFIPKRSNFTSLLMDPNLFRSVRSAGWGGGYPVRLTTETLIVALATPDFSMPYNVICLACTVVALAFGPLHNITTKRFIIAKDTEKKGLIRILLSYILLIIPKKFRSQKEQEEEGESLVEEAEKAGIEATETASSQTETSGRKKKEVKKQKEEKDE